jgi:hypothetical protein
MYFTQGSREWHLSDSSQDKSQLPIPILLAISRAQKQKHHEHFKRNSKKETCHSTTGGPANRQRLAGPALIVATCARIFRPNFLAFAASRRR